MMKYMRFMDKRDLKLIPKTWNQMQGLVIGLVTMYFVTLCSTYMAIHE